LRVGAFIIARRYRYALDKNTVVVVDEVSLVGTRQFLDLLKLREERGFQLVAIGDQKQCQSVEAGNVIDLVNRALPGSVPEIVTSIRQKHEREREREREREIAGLFREGKAKQALDMKREDNTAILVAGGREATARRVADLWGERMEANKHDPDFAITVSAATREDARTVSAAIRSQLQAAGRIGADTVVVQAANNEGEVYFMPIAPGIASSVCARCSPPAMIRSRSTAPC
jgi:ATP-dependent exoDNAse (exonuclease V) alpha subunit